MKIFGIASRQRWDCLWQWDCTQGLGVWQARESDPVMGTRTRGGALKVDRAELVKGSLYYLIDRLFLRDVGLKFKNSC